MARSTPKSRKLAKKISRKLPVGRSTEFHKPATDYDRRDSKSAIEQELFEMDKEDDMKNYTRAKAIAEKVFDYMNEEGVNATYLLDAEPPVIKVYGITPEIVTITFDVKTDGK